jgi:hypothetical protein
MRHSIDVRNYALVSIWGRDSVTVPVPWRINWTLKDQPRFESAGKVVIKSESLLNDARSTNRDPAHLNFPCQPA